LLLTLVFGVLLKANTAGFPYPLFAFAGLAGWWLFSKALMAVAGSLQDNMGLISKVYFPRLLLPLAAAAKELFDSSILLAMLLVVSVSYGFWPSLQALWILPILLFAALLGIGIGLWFCAIMVKFRDMRPMLTLILQAGMYATPIVYAAEMVPERFLSIYMLNPMYWVVELSRWALLGKAVAITPQFYWATGASLTVLVGGLLLFSFTEKLAVDVQ
jgi:lipopolysaccharide transport system permease protein